MLARLNEAVMELGDIENWANVLYTNESWNMKR
eukprot:CAMPEP_0117430126 /NCGR_PEP_ID=MMETSP0758-20121206/9642_1 /TAXON_ID=63605 /ORGANISM="Percolomonas cosmopolitus, Strain AE-1 (ATCC 50343)" /LENGTH=32 /DNA_ID= /DNA_START= /DNA_END= /DNA_ORIENTATION=